MSSGLGRAATRGALWLGLVNLLSKGSQVVVTLALGVFLTAPELGTFTITIAFLNLAAILQSVGVVDVITRTQEDPRRFAGTVATMSLAAAILLGVVLALSSPLLANAAGAPQSADLLRVCAITLPFAAYTVIQTGLVHRELDFRRRLVPDAGSALAGAAVTVSAAAAGLGSWSPVIGLLVTAVLSPVLGLAVGIKIPLTWHRAYVRPVLSWVSITGPGAVLGLVLLNVDYIVISRVLGEAATGIYSFAFRIVFVPYIMIAMVLGAVAFPVYARLFTADGLEAVQPAFNRFVHVVMATTGGAYLAIALLADRIVVINPRWEASVTSLRVLTVYGLLLGLVLAGHEVLRAVGRPGAYLRIQAIHVSVLIGGAVAMVRFGILGVAWAQVGAVAVAVIFVAHALRRSRLLKLSVLPALARPLLAAGLVAAVHQLASRLGVLPQNSSLAGALLLGTAVLLAYVAALLLVDRPLFADTRAALRARKTATIDEMGPAT